jgi:L-idonate 5-dehydrogenase
MIGRLIGEGIAMKAAVIHALRDLRIEETGLPQAGPRDVTVRVRAGGICGSDLHYYLHGGIGTIRLREPMVLGHEAAGEVVAVGAEVTRVKPGDRVAVNPSLACGHCRFCLAGQGNHCLDMRFYGSAMRFPHVQGAFREMLVCDESQAVPADMPPERAAFAEPLSVCLHAARQAGPLLGARVLVTGAGPIGALCVMVARHAGAREVVATDLLDAPLVAARRVGADHVLNMRETPDALAPWTADKGQFDVVFEASGSGAAIASAIPVARPGAVIVQCGLGGAETAVPLNAVVAKEITLRGTFRFHEEFSLAVQVLARGEIDVAPLLTEVVPLGEAVRAFELAADRGRAMKVQLAM